MFNEVRGKLRVRIEEEGPEFQGQNRDNEVVLLDRVRVLWDC